MHPDFWAAGIALGLVTGYLLGRLARRRPPRPEVVAEPGDYLAPVCAALERPLPWPAFAPAEAAPEAAAALRPEPAGVRSEDRLLADLLEAKRRLDQDTMRLLRSSAAQPQLDLDAPPRSDGDGETRFLEHHLQLERDARRRLARD